MCGSGFSLALFVDPSQIKERHKCCVCRLVVNRPVQNNSYMFCQTCILRPDEVSRVCPNYEDSESFEDKACHREVMAMSVYCVHRTEGCKWMGCLEHFQVHISLCKYEFRSSGLPNKVVHCLLCGQYLVPKSLQAHLQRVCPQIAQSDNKPIKFCSGLYTGICKIYSMIGTRAPPNEYKLRDPYYNSRYLPAYGELDPDLCFENDWEEASSVKDVDDKLRDLVSSMIRTHSELTQKVLKSLYDRLGSSKFIDMVTSQYVCTAPDDFKSSLSRSSNVQPSFQTILKECRNRIDLCNWSDVSCLSTLLKLSQLSPAFVQQEQKLLNQFDLCLYTNLARLSYLLQAKQILLRQQPIDLQSNEQQLEQSDVHSTDLWSEHSEYSSHEGNLFVTSTPEETRPMKLEQDAVSIEGDEFATAEEFFASLCT